MNTKLGNNVIVSNEFEELLSFKNEEDKIIHNAQMISYRILSEVEKFCEVKNIKKKDLAEMVGTSRSYITQLFTGTKSINTYMMAKFEEALKINFNIRINQVDECYHEEFEGLSENCTFAKRNKSSKIGAWYFCYNKREPEKEIINILKTENTQKQTAA